MHNSRRCGPSVGLVRVRVRVRARVRVRVRVRAWIRVRVRVRVRVGVRVRVWARVRVRVRVGVRVVGRPSGGREQPQSQRLGQQVEIPNEAQPHAARAQLDLLVGDDPVEEREQPLHLGGEAGGWSLEARGWRLEAGG